MPSSLFSEDARAAFARAAQATHDPDPRRRPYPSPVDWRSQPIYFLMLDRFDNPNDTPKEPHNVPFDDYQGGTFKGVQRRLPYIKGMGFGAIWITPVLKPLQWDAGAYHGYGIHDFIGVNPRFASDVAAAQADPSVAERELQELVQAAHDVGLYVILDVVYNHAGNLFGYDSGGAPGAHGERSYKWDGDPYQIFWRDASGVAQAGLTAIPDNPSREAFVWPIELQRNDFFRRRGKDSGDELTGDFYSLKEIVTNYQDDGGRAMVRDLLIRAYQYVIARFDVDGFRIDTIKHVEPQFAQVFGNAVREYAYSIGKENFFTFGEARDGSEDKLANFVGRETERAGEPVGVDAALDFPLYFTLAPFVKAFGDGVEPGRILDIFRTRREVQKKRLSTHGDASQFFVTFLDNHDEGSGFRFTPGDARFDPQFALGFGLLLGLQGIPCIYYGTELGLPGMGTGGDKGVREALWGQEGAFSVDNPHYKTLQTLLGLRDREPALRFGRQYFRPVSGDRRTWGISPYKKGILAVSRVLNDREVVLVANPNPAPDATRTIHILVDHFLNAEGTAYRLLYSNLAGDGLTAPGRVNLDVGSEVRVLEPEGGVHDGGPVNSVEVALRPMELQIIGQ